MILYTIRYNAHRVGGDWVYIVTKNPIKSIVEANAVALHYEKAGFFVEIVKNVFTLSSSTVVYNSNSGQISG